MGSTMDVLLSAGVGIGLAAACGFRVFVPLLVLSVAARGGYVPLSEGFTWIASDGALVAFGVATVAEVAAYYVPWLDNGLDLLATPAAVAAGVIASASVLTDVPPLLKWSVALIAGGGAAGVVQGTTTLLRLKSTATTGGLANPLVATSELGGSIVTAILAIAFPIACLVVLAVVVFVVYRMSKRFIFGRRGPAAGRSVVAP